MYSFKDDYSEGSHERILNALVLTNLEQETGYGLDKHSLNAANKIKILLEDDNADIHFISGGTQTNLIAISSFLRPHEACIAVASGHIAVHETGAIEATGHKIITVPDVKGKLVPDRIIEALEIHCDEHMVKPRMVYISNSTEVGTIYTKSELTELSNICLKHNLLLYLDGARLGSALASIENDLCLSDIYKLTDAFYIGGTKNGALFGEALVIRNDNLKADIRYLIKQKGALLAKGRLLGIQFEELFKDDLFFKLAQNANNMASLLTNAIKEKGYDFLFESSTNQIFPIFPLAKILLLEKEFDFYRWEEVSPNMFAIRLVTSWATTKESVDYFIGKL